jgi:uncharacterized protein (DUF1800 family)
MGMRILLAVTWLAFLGAPTTDTTRRDAAASGPLTPRDSALHALNRLAYGPRPGEVGRVAAMGVMHWIDQQLDPARLPDRVLAGREQAFGVLDLDPEALAAIFANARRDQTERRRAFEQLRQVVGQVQQLAVVRAVLSERQLREIMIDFWVNHFNVYFGKGADRVLMPVYIEHTLRPRALGRFEDLLIATAQSPAMMFYLDNWESVARGAVPPGADPVRPGSQAAPRGPNENYARELLELHTLGVDGGYTQRDVIEVARVFTGWSIARPAQSGRFQFYPWAHDAGEKHVRGVRFPPGHGQDEGLRLLKLLANDPATIRHVSYKLCARFVSDDPPDGCVDDAVDAWRRSGGDITQIVRAIVRSPDFWSPQAMRAKVKTPLEFVVSAVRAVGGEPDSTPELADVVGRLGQPLYMEPSPAGYPESQDEWVNSGALLHRMNAAVAIAAGQLPGVTVSLDGVVTASHAPDILIAAVDDRLLGGILSPRTRAVLRDQLNTVHDPQVARSLVVGLALGGPEFQKQ